MSYDRRHRIARLDAGPVGRVLAEKWNSVHDIEYDLNKATESYYDAAHFMGGPAEKAAKLMIKEVEAVVSELKTISMRRFNALTDLEDRFVTKYGDPKDYADQMRAKIFPR